MVRAKWRGAATLWDKNGSAFADRLLRIPLASPLFPSPFSAMTRLLRLRIVEHARSWAERAAIRVPASAASGAETTTTTYQDLLEDSARLARHLQEKGTTRGSTIGIAAGVRGGDFAALQWGVWRAGGVVVPIHPALPTPEVEYLCHDSEVQLVLGGTGAGNVPSGVDVLTVDELRRDHGILSHSTGVSSDAVALATDVPGVDEEWDNGDALIVYTSGTTGRPKGVVHTHGSLDQQAAAMMDAWEWTADDRLLHWLPLHHVHGLVNGLHTPLSYGASIDMLLGFDAVQVWEAMARGECTLFFAVPTIYVKLLAALRSASADDAERWLAGARKMRLMVSGSAALPPPLLEEWRQATGQQLLERYGSTEGGMLLTNQLLEDGVQRLPGYVGYPFPGVDVRIEGDDDGDVSGAGELLVRGEGLFDRYFNNEEATCDAFTDDGWFKTGDTAIFDEQAGFKILGRTSVDMLKSGGEKMSALEIEERLLELPEIAECAVVGVDDAEWGQRVVAIVVAPDGGLVDPPAIIGKLKDVLPPFKVPKEVVTWPDSDGLPRNAMGKINKKDLVKRLEEMQ